MSVSLWTALLLGLFCFSRGTEHYRTVLHVDKDGYGNFTSIQSAIDYVPSDNNNWVCIRISGGTYREKVTIPYNKPYIVLKGAAKRRTLVVWGDYVSLAQSPTFSSFADNIVVKSITFVNSYNSPGSNNPRRPAVAALIAGDKSSFYRCGFSSVQDTLWDAEGRHYFYRCTIQGAVDFIFGSGQSLYESCGINVIGGELENGLAGFITAQGRDNPNEANGFVFKSCRVFGSGSTFLGRPWRAYSRVLFYNSNFSEVIQPKGWQAWTFAGHEKELTFAEHSNFGPGSDTSQRVSWEKQLSQDEVQKLTSFNFIDGEGWLQSQPN